MEVHVVKNINTSWRLHGIPCGILNGITVEHDGSLWSFHVFMPMCRINTEKVFHGNSMEYFTWNSIKSP